MEAFEILAEQYRPMVLAYLRSVVRDAELAEDLTQESFVTAQKVLPSFQKGGNFGAWLRGIARKKVLESRRASRRHAIVTDSRIVAGMEDVYSSFDKLSPEHETWTERLAVLKDCVGQLGGNLRQAVDEVYEKRRTLHGAAQVLNISFDAIAQRLHRARALLRKCVAGKTGAGSAS